MPTARKAGGSDFVQSVDRVFAVIHAFGRDSELTLTEVAKRANLTRATARRFLLTLEALGYIGSDGSEFFLRPRLLDLGFAYISSVPVWEMAEAHMEALVQHIEESSAASVLEGDDILFTVRVPIKRLMSIQLEVGTRLPAHATSMGRVLIAALSPTELDKYLKTATFRKLTSNTVTSMREMKAILSEVRNQGWCLLDQELEVGLRSIAVPLRDCAGEVFAAINVATNATRVPVKHLLSEYLPLLQKTALAIDADVASRRWRIKDRRNARNSS